MPAILPHHTDTSDGPWDAAEQEARLESGRDFDYYARMYAYISPDADPQYKASYKFPHHYVDDAGEPGEASLRACRAGLAVVLRGARGGAKIERDAVAGVAEHLITHMEDGGWEVPDWARDEIEFHRRGAEVVTGSEAPAEFTTQVIAEIRSEDGELAGRISGIAWDYSQPDVYGDRFAPGAFTDSITREDGTPRRFPLLWQHDPKEVIGVAEAREGANRLHISARLDMEDPLAVKVAGKIKRGLVSGLSIGFTASPDDIEVTPSGRVIRRARLWEVSVVTLPAHDSARITGVRSAVTGCTEEVNMEANNTQQQQHPQAAPVAPIGSTAGAAGLGDLRELKFGPVVVPASLLTYERRAVLTIGGLTGGVRREVEAPVPPKSPRLFLRDLLSVAPVDGNAVEFIRLTRSGAASPQVEAGSKAEITFTPSAAVAYVTTIAAIMNVSRQALEDVPELEQVIGPAMIEAVLEAEETRCLTGDGIGANILGLVAQASSFDTSRLEGAWNQLDVLAAAAKQAEDDSGVPADFAIVHTNTFWQLMTIKDKNNNYLLGGPGSLPGALQAWGLRIIRSNAIPAGYFLVGSSSPRAVVLREREGVNVVASTEHATNFASNIVTLRAEERVALVVYRPAAFVYGQLSSSLN